MANEPFTEPCEPGDPPWWLRDAEDAELARHWQLLAELTKLESNWTLEHWAQTQRPKE